MIGEKRITGEERKEKIRSRYQGVDPSKLVVIPPKVKINDGALEEQKLRVAAYIRVSTENDEQTSSFELQHNDFTDRINANPNWDLAGIYSDEGISGTELSHRKGMLQLIEDCKAGKIDLVLAKSIARFARNVVDCLSVIKELKNAGVGVRFDENNLYTMDATGSLVLTILATVAEEESRSKSFIMNWSIERRFSKGIFLTPELLGYDLDEDGNLVVNPEEAETVKVIYYLYINGWTQSEIASLLTSYGRKTKPGNEIWHSSSIDGVMENEHHCGDILARKTYTPDFQTHKSVKNNGEMKQIYYPDHHEPIVSRPVFDEANRIRASRTYHKRRKPIPVLSVIDSGVLKGFVPVDKDWKGFSAEEYQAASQSAYAETDDRPTGHENATRTGVNMTGYQSIRGEFFASTSAPAMTITRGRMRFNTACLKKFEDVEYVELLINTVNNSIAVRPCSMDNPNAIHWGTLRERRWYVSEIGFKGFASVLFGLMNWENNTCYKFRGQFICRGSEKMLLFELAEPQMIKTIEQVVPVQQEDGDDDTASQTAQEEIVVTEKVRILPPLWEVTFGTPFTSYASLRMLERVPLDGEWEVLRPARELTELNALTANDRKNFLHEAEAIIEGWGRQMTTDVRADGRGADELVE